MTNLEVLAAISKSDHTRGLLTLDFQCSWSQDITDTLRYMYGKGEYDKLRKMVSGTDCEEQLDGKTSMDNRQITARRSSSQLHTKEDYSTGRCTEQETMEHVGHNRES